MKASKKEAVTRELTAKQKAKRRNMRLIIISGVLSIVVFIALLVIQSTILAEESTTTIVVAATDIEAGTKITEDNLNTYFTTSERVTNQLPSDYITDMNDLLNTFVHVDYKENEVVTSDTILEEDYALGDFDKPIETVFSVNSTTNALAGTLREGDRINIYRVYTTSDVDENGEEYEYVVSEPVMLGAYISKAYSGVVSTVASDDNETATYMFGVIIEEDMEALFNQAFYEGNLKISKILYDTDETTKNELYGYTYESELIDVEAPVVEEEPEEEVVEETEEEVEYNFNEYSTAMTTTVETNVYDTPALDGEIIDTYEAETQLDVTGDCIETGAIRVIITLEDEEAITGYVDSACFE